MSLRQTNKQNYKKTFNISFQYVTVFDTCCYGYISVATRKVMRFHSWPSFQKKFPTVPQNTVSINFIGNTFCQRNNPTKQNVIHLHCIWVAAEITETHIIKPGHVKLKLSAWLNTTIHK